MDFQTMRIYGSVAIILGCFIFLYPKLLHPVVLTLFGMNDKSPETKSDGYIPPPLRGKVHQDMPQPGQSDLPDHIRKMRHGPHPGMRAAAAEQSKQTKGSGRGMMGVILPMYAVGIVVYLVYTLFKVFGKSDKSGHSRSPSRDVPRPSYDIGPQGDEQEEMDMRKLQERLAETEAQMTKILAAMQSVQTKVTDVAPAAVGKPAQEGEADEKKEPVNVSDRSSESSPESESYEIVNKSDRESSGDENSPRKVETLTSVTAEEIQEEDEDKVEETGENEDYKESQEDEVTEEILKDKEEDEESKTVRKRITKKDETES